MSNSNAESVESEPEPEKEPRPENSRFAEFRWHLRRLCNSKWFNAFIIFLIVANAITLAMDSPGASQGLKDVLDVFELVFLILFTIEMVLKMIAFGLGLPGFPKNEFYEGYFRDGWNWLDFIIVVVGLVHSLIVHACRHFFDRGLPLTLETLFDDCVIVSLEPVTNMDPSRHFCILRLGNGTSIRWNQSIGVASHACLPSSQGGRQSRRHASLGGILGGSWSGSLQRVGPFVILFGDVLDRGCPIVYRGVESTMLHAGHSK